ncbi:SAM-dependent methyltransferase [Paenibacillus polymyxa]|uniref:SAM-dependent methyltransferase n=1 Tax=Paenibacillus polymyxa TaxID=1406 RepID=UPI003216CE22
MNNKTAVSKVEWWMEEYGFFGDFYIEGDDSKEGYLDEKKQTLADRTQSEAQGVIDLLNLKPGSKLLDCPCGYGRHSIELLSRGIDVVGCDINSSHLAKAINDAQTRGLKSDFRKENMLELDFKGEFDAVINMFYSFGFFETDEENFQVLVNFYNALKPGGKFLMHTDVNIPRVLQGHYKFNEVRPLVSNRNLRIIDNYDPVTKRVNGSWIISDSSGNERAFDYSVRVYGKEEFEELCLKAGFRKVTTYSEWDGSSYSENSEDMMVVSEK